MAIIPLGSSPQDRVWFGVKLLRSGRRAFVVLGFALAVSGCNPVARPADQMPDVITDPQARLSFTMRNAEIRQDILTALTDQGIEHWLNADGSVGFYSRDSEVVDAIGFNAIGAYAARN